MKKLFILGTLIMFLSSFINAARLDVGQDKIVKVNNHVITERELEKRFNEMSKFPTADGKSPSKKSILQSMIDEYLLREELKNNKTLVLDDSQFQAMLNQYKNMYKQQMLQDDPKFTYSDDKFKEYVEKEGMITYENFEDRIKEQVLARQFIMKKAEKKLQGLKDKTYSSKNDYPINVPNMKGGMEKYYSIDEFYDKNIAEFTVPKSIELKHIFLSTVDQNLTKLPQNEIDRKKKKIEDIQKRLVKGESFDTLCEMESEDTESRDKKNPKTGKIDRGYLGLLAINDETIKQQFGEEVFTSLFNLEKGTYSGVVETKFGYHIFYVVDKKTHYIMPFDEAKQQIIEYFKQVEYNKIVADEFQGIVKQLRQAASIVYYDEQYKE